MMSICVRTFDRHSFSWICSCILWTCGVVPFCVGGCASYIDPNVPEMIRPLVEPEYNSEYLLYRPSHYNRKASWPLVILCHGSFVDSPDKIIREWTQFAEVDGFLVAAPRMQKVGSLFSSEPQKQIATLREQQERILAVIGHIRAGQEISEDRIFLYGRSGGSHATLYTGLNNPELIRAIAISNPKFDAEYLEGVEDRLDPHQPVFVEYSASDRMLGNHAKKCMDWLRSAHVDLTANSSADSRDDAAPLVGFFEEVIRRKPWIHFRVSAGTTGNGLEVRFALRRSFTPVRASWDFGDGQHASDLAPTHTYANPGSYRIFVALEHPDGQEHRRTAILTVPDLVLSNAKPHSANSETPK